jgi:hypothetical protein
MGRIQRFARKAGLAGAVGGGATLLGTAAALAVSVLLPPGGSLGVPSTTAATEPDLAGVVVHDVLVPFTIRTATGVLCAGNLQDRVVRSNRTHRLHFYYRIRDTKGPGAINRIATVSFAVPMLRVAYRTDGLGTVPPRQASRSGGTGALVTFTFSDPPISCARHQESRFVLLKTTATAFATGGTTRILATTGAGASVPTVKP